MSDQPQRGMRLGALYLPFSHPDYHSHHIDSCTFPQNTDMTQDDTHLTAGSAFHSQAPKNWTRWAQIVQHSNLKKEWSVSGPRKQYGRLLAFQTENWQ
tara:strand:+ start:216 stop:509 length:294 start_codon:yes stop_codon:yes gene_type:complete